MESKIKPKRVYRRRSVKPTQLSRPEEVVEGSKNGRNDTDKNMLTMFNILRKNRSVNLENLV